MVVPGAGSVHIDLRQVCSPTFRDSGATADQAGVVGFRSHRSKHITQEPRPLPGDPEPAWIPAPPKPSSARLVWGLCCS